MTTYELEKHWLSLKYWVRSSVLPITLLLLLMLLLLKFWFTDLSSQNHNSLIIGFFCFYFILIRGGHLIMIRSMHFELKKKYGDAYNERLSYLPRDLRRYNIGFTLARIKRDLVNMKKSSA